VGVSRILGCFFGVCVVFSCGVMPAFAGTPVVAIIIDDLGDHWENGLRAVQLPGPVACAVMPYRPYSERFSVEAYLQNKEVLLHLPMEPKTVRFSTPGLLTHSLSRQEMLSAMYDALHSLPYVDGMNNHMGSLLTSKETHMSWLMQELSLLDALFFIDSRTSADSVAFSMAKKHGVSSTQRDIFLDHVRDKGSIATKLDETVQLAKTQGSALAIGHPYPETLAVLEEVLARLPEYGVQMVTVSSLLALRKNGR
jgi:uncharacterized protein